MEDHEALTRAAAAGPVLPFVVIEPDWWAGDDMSGRQYAFFRESAAEFVAHMNQRGLPVHVHIGDVSTVLEAALANFGPFTLWAHQETGNAWTHARDRKVRQWMKDHELVFHEPVQHGVRRGAALNRDRWAREWDAQMSAPIIDPPSDREPLSLGLSVAIPDTLQVFAPDEIANRQIGGRTAALATLDSFLHQRGQNYRTDMSSPILGETGCSRLSAHMAWGTISVREVFQATRARIATLSTDNSAGAKAWRASLTAFVGRLHWHCHFTQKLETEPAIEWRPTARVYEGMRPPPSPAVIAAYREGQTGFPFADACLRQLKATGWINFRMRAMLMSFACYDLWMPWQTAGTILARLFTDYDPGVHWPQSQMQSGETGINTLRIYSTVKQGRDHDPNGDYIRQWVPELAGVSGAAVHEPWLGGGVVGYVAPIVDRAVSVKAARDAIWTIRKTPAARAEAAAILQKHGSRRRPPARRATAERKEKAVDAI